MTQLLSPRDMEFMLYEVFDAEELTSRPRYEEHSKETFDSTLDTAQQLAEQYFADHNAKGDANEPAFDGKSITMVPETKAAWDAFADAGFLAAQADFEDGGTQLPDIIIRASLAYFSAANISSLTYATLTMGAANLIRTFGDDAQKTTYLPPMQDGRFSGTMALTEPDQGSSLADIKTIAKPVGDGTYRLFGQKMFISAGDHDLTENIVHLVLARIEGAPPGTRGISLFICPKFLVDDDGSIGERNDVSTAGLFHKMGYRNTTSTVLSFGEKDGAVGYLVGEPHRGLQYMFLMMNEARISVGLGAASLAYQGFNHSLDYARERPQGRLPSNKDVASRQVNIVEHADVRRMLLAQKAYAEGALAMCLYASRLVDELACAETEEDRHDIELLLDLVTPVVKSWPSKYGTLANDHAIQVLGGAGYIREYPVEQYYRDNRLNAIHEGTEGIHGLDLLGRKVLLHDGQALKMFLKLVGHDIETAAAQDELAGLATQMGKALKTLGETTLALAMKIKADPDVGLANSSVYLDLFGRVFASWIWLKQASRANEALSGGGLKEDDVNFYRGKLQAAHFYIDWELPQVYQQADLLQRFDTIPFDMRDAWFQAN